MKAKATEEEAPHSKETDLPNKKQCICFVAALSDPTPKTCFVGGRDTSIATNLSSWFQVLAILLHPWWKEKEEKEEEGGEETFPDDAPSPVLSLFSLLLLRRLMPLIYFRKCLLPSVSPASSIWRRFPSHFPLSLFPPLSRSGKILKRGGGENQATPLTVEIPEKGGKSRKLSWPGSDLNSLHALHAFFPSHLPH